MTATLTSIVDLTRRRVSELRLKVGELEDRARNAPVPVPWGSGLRQDDVAVIAEIKRRSPSKGDIATQLDPAAHARAYVRGGARGISVLTEGPHFGGSLDDLAQVRASVDTPLLRKDFVVDPAQIYETRIVGASAVLLIVRALDSAELRELASLARELRLAILVEVHTPTELERAVLLEPDAVGVNSRDLETFQVDTIRAAAILRSIPEHLVAVAESGLHTRADVECVAECGADAILVGTAVASSAKPADAVRALTGVSRCRRSG